MQDYYNDLEISREKARMLFRLHNARLQSKDFVENDEFFEFRLHNVRLQSVFFHTHRTPLFYLDCTMRDYNLLEKVNNT